ncbi:unnamed protein product [Pseudo-nitzschia multistriata]|uniref:Fungal lipase-type domain-containing protein n=1 Tax=Pseudo-nitzschia multistriata TaxID=183589 RepID=A0A448ZLC3_9STRA|nr:unnamed protein product [Pseudo-nitzschia multistriata]
MMGMMAQRAFVIPNRLLVQTGLAVSFLFLLANTAIHGKPRHSAIDKYVAYSEVFPSLKDVATMANLSHLVYKFKSERNFTCADFYPSVENNTEHLTCELYIHEYFLGTQVLMLSNNKEKYIAIVFAGTDDIMTMIEDTNILTKPFGNNSTVHLTPKANQLKERAKVHSGFNNAVFTHDIWERIYAKTKYLMHLHPTYRLWTTGHSLGGANAILTATAFASLNRNRRVLSVSFGCPQTGNYYWREYFNDTSPLSNNLGIWRVVLGWDLVPRLPEFFHHVGHTIQIDVKTGESKAYYEHYGNVERGYAGVPNGWYAKSHAWLPSALSFHRMTKYVENIAKLEPASWAKHFYPVHSNVYDDDDDDINPLDDWPGQDETQFIDTY